MEKKINGLKFEKSDNLIKNRKTRFIKKKKRK